MKSRNRDVVLDRRRAGLKGVRQAVAGAIVGLSLAACGDVDPDQRGRANNSGAHEEAPSSKVAAWRSDAEALGDPRLSDLVARGYVSLDLGGASRDATVVRDARELLIGTLDSVAALDFEAGHRISLQYLGRGELGGSPQDAADPVSTSGADVEPLRGMDAFNPATRNEFRLVLSEDLLGAIGEHDAARGLDRGTPDRPVDVAAGSHEVPVDTDRTPKSWSNGVDNRFRVYGVDEPVTNSTHRRIVQLGGGCSGTLVGPRHVVTAGHCLWSRANQRWSDDFWVRAGANGTSSVARVFVDNDNIPAGQVLWYFTPSQYRSTTGSTWGFDYGILVVPSRIGDTTGWMGRVAYTGTAFAQTSVYRRGYPACTATLPNGTPRIDEPNPCSENHLYASGGTCSLGEYQSVDSSGWSRVVHHSCDASGGDSGSPLYVFHDGAPSVAAVHFASRCEKTTTDVACTGTWEDRPLAALRLTPEYRDWIGYFRNKYP